MPKGKKETAKIAEASMFFDGMNETQIATIKSLPTITVGIPLYNGRKYMFRLLGSLNCQSIPPDEIVIIDDCSSETYDDILDLYRPYLNINYIKLPENHGVGYAREQILQNATKDYLIFVDADDILSDMFYLQTVKFLVKAEADKGEQLPSVIVPNFYSQHSNFAMNKMEQGATRPWCHGKAYNVAYAKSKNLHFQSIRAHEDSCFNGILFNFSDAKIMYTNFFSYLWRHVDSSITRAGDYIYDTYADIIKSNFYIFDTLCEDGEEENAKNQSFVTTMIDYVYYMGFKHHEKATPEGLEERKELFKSYIEHTGVKDKLMDKKFTREYVHSGGDLFKLYDDTVKYLNENKGVQPPEINIWRFLKNEYSEEK